METQIKLVKLIEGVYVEDFLDGNLYLNTCGYFKDLPPEDICRRDANEALVEIHQALSVEILDPRAKEWLKLPHVGPVRGHGDHFDHLNVLCLYMLTDRQEDTFDDRNLAFGDAAIIIHALPEFLRRLWTATRAAGWKGSGQPVEYVNQDEYEGVMGPFRKFSEYAYQREYRLVVATGEMKPVRLALGNLRDIVQVVPIQSLPSVWKQMVAALEATEVR